MVLKKEMASIRCFLAVEIPDGARRAIEAHVAPFRALTPSIRWTQPQNLHVTLKFLGSIEVSRLEAVKSAARDVCLSLNPFLLKLGGVGAFPGFRKPQVLWIGLGQGREDLSHASVLLHEALETDRIETQTKPFAAHLTVARIKLPDAQTEQVAGRFLKGELADLEPFEVKGVTLFQSELFTEGPKYTVIERFPFASTPITV